MKRVMTSVMLAVCATVAGGAAAQSVTVCRGLNGYKSEPMTGTYAEVVKAGDANAFLSNKQVPNCEVKEVEATAKGKPGTTTVFLGPMKADECSMYRSLSSIDSKLNQGKFADAYNINAVLIGKVTTLAGTGNLTATAATAINGAANVTQTCILGLM